MRLRPLIIGTFLAVCFWGISLMWQGAGNAQRQNDRREQQEHVHESFDILVTFDGEVAKKGQMVIQIYSDPDAFEKGGRPFDECFLKLDISDEVLWQFSGLPRGDYAIRAFHDANENWRLDESEGTISTEKVSYSNLNKEASLQPKYDECKFEVTRDRVIRLKW